MRSRGPFAPRRIACAVLALVAALVLVPPASAASSAPPLEWATPASIDGAPSSPDGDRLLDVSCPSTTFCAAVDGDGNVLIATAPATGPWTRTAIAPRSLTGIDCPTTSLCVATDSGGHVVTSTNPTGGAAAWTSADVDGGRRLTAIDCATPTLCIALDAGGWVVTSTDPTGGAAAWTATQFNANFAYTSVACPSTTACVLADGANVYTTTNPTGGPAAWTRTLIGTYYSYVGVFVACPSLALCVAVQDGGVGGEGIVATSTDPVAAAPTWATSGFPGAPTGVACPTTSLCVAITDMPFAYVSTDPGGGAGAWSLNAIGEAGRHLLAVDCPSASLCVVVDDAGHAIVGTAPPPVALTVAKAGTGAGGVAGAPAGIACGATCSASFPRGTTVTLTATPSAGSRFAGWSGGGCAGTGTCDVGLTAATTVTATFVATPTLTVAKAGDGGGKVTSQPGGIDCGATCSAAFDRGTSVTLTAAEDMDSDFTGWSGGGCGTQKTCTVSVAAATTVTATFARYRWLLLAVDGSGTISGDLPGLDCRDSCSYGVLAPVPVTLTATPDPGWAFMGWQHGACSGTDLCRLTWDGDLEVQAWFVRGWALTVVRQGSGQGSVVGDHGGIDCPTSCREVYGEGESVTLTATAAPGSTFAGWSGGGCAGTGSCTVASAATTTVSATFTLPVVVPDDPPDAPGPEPAPAPDSPSALAPALPPVVTSPSPTPRTPRVARPNTRLLRSKLDARRRTATFTFKATGRATSYRCALTALHKKATFKRCRSPMTFRRLRPGRYTFAVAAVGPGGADATPATKKVTVRR